MDLSNDDVPINISDIGPIPANNGEAVIWDSTRVKAGGYSYDVDPKTGIAVPTGTYLDSCNHIRSAVLALNATGQNVTFKLYWWIGAAFVLVNGSGKAVTAGTPLCEVVPFGGRGVKLAYLAGATAPSAMAIHVRFRREGYQPVVTTV